MWFICICSLLIQTLLVESQIVPGETSTSEVKIDQGTVIGSTATGGGYIQFYGIPYADSTSGTHRFKAPRPPPSFEAPFIANRSDIKCMRPLTNGIEGTEDCLVANVFTPTINETRKLPVMVWIKGQEFDRPNMPELYFSHFMEQNVIIVSLNYRQSILGFLCLGTETAPGNAGLKDIVAGLQWIKINIEKFGGNPDEITIFGHGNGGALVDLISLSPVAKGLVNKVIAQSGNAMSPWAVSRNNLKYAVQVAKGLGHEVTDVPQLSNIFASTNLNVAALMGALSELGITNNALAFAPCIENKDLEDSTPFLINTPLEILTSTNFSQIPFILGYVSKEGSIRAEQAIEGDWLQRMNTKFSDFLQSDLKFENESERLNVAGRIKEFYFNNNPIDDFTINDYIKYHGETMVLVSSIQDATIRAQFSDEPTYLYQFSYKGTLGLPFMGPLNMMTAAHSEELAYLFHGSLEDMSSMDSIIGQILVQRWTNFAKTGLPSSTTSPVEWQPFNNDSSYLHIIGDNSLRDATIEDSLSNPHPDTLEFWDEIYLNYYLDAESRWSINDEGDEGDVTTTPIPDDETTTTVLPVDDVSVTITQGIVIGSQASDGDYFQFLGIPYADSTSGINRFKAPRIPPSFEEPFVANRSDIKCVRPLTNGFEGTEDCLVANIFTPTIDYTRKLPVMVWIKGQEFDRQNMPELHFSNFMEQNVVIVSLNYRKSILGFLCLGTETAPGNAGLKDIVAGLQWIKTNIENFGGNPDEITIFGHGNGGALVDLISLSPVAKGLVNKVIAQSGNAMSPWAVSRNNLKYAVQVAKGLGHDVTDVQLLSNVFARVNVPALMGAVSKLDITNNALAFAPCIENKDLEDSTPFLINTPREILTSTNFSQLPSMLGYVSKEGSIRAEQAIEGDWLQRMNTKFSDFLQSDLKFENESEGLNVTGRIKEFYFNNNPIDDFSINGYIKYHGETMVLVSCIQNARIRAQFSDVPTYLYQFSYKGTLGLPFMGPLNMMTAAHSEELAYLLHGSHDDPSSLDLIIGQILVERWTNFAKTGRPSSTTSLVEWQPFNNHSSYLHIVGDNSLRDATIEDSLSNPHPDTLGFWDDIYENYFLDAESRWSICDEGDITTTPIPDDDPVSVIITQGIVIGSQASDGDYFQFLGIPYADSTSGINRFKAPKEPPPFEETFIANRNDIICVKPTADGYEGTEDCLVASIFTPSVDNTSSLSVMVWIKGTEFDTVNEYELSFRNFMMQDIVLVSLNYRESILGFLCLGTEVAPGNAGLKDIVAGLRWVKENIAQFGGNPDDITIFGHGSGGAAVDLVSLSPMANGLVNKAIAQSGNAMAPWAVSRDNLNYAIHVAEALGHTINDIQQLSELFIKARLDVLIGVINKLDLTDNVLAFGPCIEREVQGIEPFLTRTPSEIIKSDDFAKMPFMTGFVDHEGTIRAKEALEDNWLYSMDTSFDRFVQSDLYFENDDVKSEVTEKIREFYFEDKQIDFSNIDNYTTYHGETMILVSTIREVKRRAESSERTGESSESVYLYQFSYKGALGKPFEGPIPVETAAHSEELAYLFSLSSEEASDTDYIISQILVERWTSFAKTGIPSSTTSPVVWEPFTMDKQYYLHILDFKELRDTEDAHLEECPVDPHPRSLNFWDDIYENHFLDAKSHWSIEGPPPPPVTPCPPCPDNSSALNVSYTFSIVAIFTVLNKYYISQMFY